MLFNNNWFVSDLHINHFWVNKTGEERGVTIFERNQFKNIESHDKYIHDKLINWAKSHPEATLWILGDFGDTSYLYWIDKMRAYGPTINFIMGNHDKKTDLPKFREHFNNVYEYPVFLSPRVVLSHEPLYPAPTGILNIHGHLHRAILDSLQHMCVSIHVIEYNIVSEKVMNKRLAAIEKPCYKYLKEPYAAEYIFTQDTDEAVYDKKTMKIDLPASRELMDKKREEKNKNDKGLV